MCWSLFAEQYQAVPHCFTYITEVQYVGRAAILGAWLWTWWNGLATLQALRLKKSWSRRNSHHPQKSMCMADSMRAPLVQGYAGFWQISCYTHTNHDNCFWCLYTSVADACMLLADDATYTLLLVDCKSREPGAQPKAAGTKGICISHRFPNFLAPKFHCKISHNFRRLWP